MKGNTTLILVAGLTMIFVLAISISSLNLPVKAQGQNQTSPQQSQEVQNKLGVLTQKFRELVTKSGVNITLPQSGNLADHLRNLTQSSGFKTLSQQLPQLSDLGINETRIKTLQNGNNNLPGLVQKLSVLTDIIP
jgi:hypothetical protein